MIRLLVAAGVGYVLGARAGRGRYEQLLQLSKSVRESPVVADAIATARKEVGALLNDQARANEQTVIDGETHFAPQTPPPPASS